MDKMMVRRSLSRWIAGALALVFCWGMAGTGRAQAAATTSFDVVQVELSLDRHKVVVGEPVSLRIRLTNTSAAPLLTVMSSFHLPVGNGIELNVQPPGELPYRYDGALELGSYVSVPVPLRANTPEVVDVLLYFDRTQPNGLIFPRPGTYTVDGKFRFSLEKNPNLLEAVLPPTQVTVEEPQGDDKKVLELLDKPVYIFALHTGGVTTQTLDRVHEAATQFPHTAMGALALKSEGQYYARQPEPENRIKGAVLLTKVLRDGVMKTDTDTVAWEVAAAYHRAGSYDLAREWVYWILRTFPSSPLIQSADPLMNFYYFQPAEFTENEPWYLVKEPWKVPGAKPPADLRPVTKNAGAGL